MNSAADGIVPGPEVPPPLSSITTRMMWNQLLWTAGYALTSGGFLLYFGKELGADALIIAFLLVIPETVGTSGLLARWVLRHIGSRKRVYIGGSLVARLVMLGIPLMGFQATRPVGINPLWVLVICLALTHAVQSIVFVAYLSWLSDLAPEHHWGRFFAWRNIAKLAALLVIPVTGGFLRDAWRNYRDPSEALIAYELAFLIGWVLMLLSLWPMRKLPDPPLRLPEDRPSDWKVLRDSWRDRSLRFLLIHNWWLAFANGITQSAFFGYLFGPLGIGLGLFYTLQCVMRFCKLPVSWFTGVLCDHFGNKRPLVVGVVAASSGLVFWLLATPEQWGWVFAAYAFWGLYAAANIAGRNLTLTLAPRSDNTTQLALFRQIGGLFAGLSGILGGWWLKSLNETNTTWHWGEIELSSFQIIIAVSLLGRWSAVLWLIPVSDPQGDDLRHMVKSYKRWKQR